MDRIFTVTLVVPGTLTADKTLRWTAATDCQLLHVSANCAVADATLTLQADGTPLLEAFPVPAGGTPATATRSAFVGAQYPHIAQGRTLAATIGHGAGCVDFVAVLTFSEG